jgi:hypothetical protein
MQQFIGSGPKNLVLSPVANAKSRKSPIKKITLCMAVCTSQFAFSLKFTFFHNLTKKTPVRQS